LRVQDIHQAREFPNVAEDGVDVAGGETQAPQRREVADELHQFPLPRERIYL